MKKVIFVKNEILISNPLFLSGITRAGKFFLGKLLSGFEKIEYFQYVSILEHLPFMVSSGVINKDAAIALLRVNVDEHAYNYWIGRNLNLRFDDASSVTNSAEKDLYFVRSKKPVNESLTMEIRKSGRYSSFILHESLPQIEVYFKAFPGLRWINLLRHPIDLIYSWHLRGWGNRQVSDALSFCPVVKGVNSVFPWYVQGWECEYASMPGIDRIIKIITRLSEMDKAAYQALNEGQKKQILFIIYENLVEKTNLELDKLGAFLKIKPMPGLGLILKKEKCPRQLLLEQRLKKAKTIKKIAGKKKFDLMMKVSFDYEKQVLLS